MELKYGSLDPGKLMSFLQEGRVPRRKRVVLGNGECE